MLTRSDAEKLVHAFMTSRLDYCNALLGGCPACSINKLQIVHNATARVLTRSRKYDHITPILLSLHWLPIKFRISYKILLLAYKALNDLAPAYLTNLLSRYNPTRSLILQNAGLLVVPRIASQDSKYSNMACSVPLQNAATRELCTGPYGQLSDRSVHQPPRRSTPPSHVATRPPSPPWSQKHLRSLRTIHVPGKLNRAADELSRQPALPGEWQLQVVQLIWRRFGDAQLDLFASPDTSHC